MDATETSRIVVGDDHPLVQAALFAALAECLPNAEVIACYDIEQVLHALTAAEGGVDLVLLDLLMPGTQGLMGLFILLKQHPTVPVAILSALQDPSTIRRAIGFGASGYIPKSLGLPEMSVAIRRILLGEIWAPFDMTGAGQQDDDADVSRRMVSLSPQQMRILSMIVEGKLNKQIAAELNLAEQIVKVHVSTILRKLGVNTRTQAAIMVERLTVKQSPV